MARLRSHISPLALFFAVFCASLVFNSIPAQAQTFTIAPSSVNYKNVVVGLESNVFEITITNTGTSSINITAFTLSPFNTFILEYGWTRSLHPGQYGMWAVRFRPQAAGVVTGQMSFTIEGVSQPQVVTLTGTGVTTAAAASLTNNVLKYPATPVGTTATQIVTINNTGTAPMNLTGVTTLPPFNSDFSTAVNIQPSTSYSLPITFTPTQAQSYTNAISLTFDVVPSQTVSVAGSGAKPAALAVSSFPTLPTGSQNFAYSANLAALGGKPPYKWTLFSGSLPTGLSLQQSGSLTGPLNVAATGNYSFTVKVTDSIAPQQSATAALTLPVTTGTAACNNITWDQAGTLQPELDLPDLGKGTYKGTQGGLYPGGSNVMPANHLSDGLALANGIVPLDANGNYDPNGQYVLLSIGVSISHTMWSWFEITEKVDPLINPHLVIVDGTIDGTDSPNYANFKDGSWQTILNFFLPYQNVTAKQVVAVWMMDPRSQPSGTFPSDMALQESDVISALQNMQIYFPNLKIAYLESMHYGGYAVNNPEILPEPYAYETGFAMQTVIADQINGQSDLNYNPLNGPVVAPWIAWGTYDWANGMLANGTALPLSSGLEWSCSDYSPDGVHASIAGKYKDAALLTSFFKTDPTVTPWFLAPQ